MTPSNSFFRLGSCALAAALFIALWTVHAPIAQAQESNASSSATPPSKTAVQAVDINSADAKAIATLPGIGPVLAQRIIEGRPYKNLDDLGKIKGLTKVKLEALKNDVTFGAPVAAKEKPARSATAAESKARGSTTTAAKEQPPTTTTAAPVRATERSASKPAPGGKININTATAAELDALPGIGPTRAKAIVDYRAQNGNFKTIEDIEKVKGIKGGVFSKLKDRIKVTD
jgi:competence protein ComEA